MLLHKLCFLHQICGDYRMKIQDGQCLSSRILHLLMNYVTQRLVQTVWSLHNIYYFLMLYSELNV